jgi:hypothetical protein
LTDVEEIIDTLTKECYYKNIEELFKEGLLSEADLELYYKDASTIVIDVPSVSFKNGRKIINRKKYHITVQVYIGAGQPND